MPGKRRLSLSNIAIGLALGLLIAAGGAYAGAKLAKNSVASRQVKNGSLTGRDVKDDSLTGKDINESSLSLPDGPRGATGAQGIQGVPGQGTTGPAGPLLDTLPSGQTLRGGWGVGSQNSAGTGSSYGSISFPYPLASAPTGHVLAVGGGGGTNCPGSVSQPEARAGHLCVYTAVSNGADPVQTCDFANVGCGTTSRFGAALELTQSGTQVFYAWGTWAVTAP